MMDNMNTGIYEHLFEHYPANENLELDIFQMALVARETLPYIELLNESDIFKEEDKIKEIDYMVTEKDKRFREARKLMNKTLLKDKGLYYGYQSNIAMLLYDEQEGNNDKPIDYKDHDNRNEIAKKIVDLIFS